jgi:hypothetical protein
MKTAWFLVPFLFAVGAVSVCRASDITYNVNLTVNPTCNFSYGTCATVIGDIVTDGANGPLAPSDIVSWSMLLTNICETCSGAGDSEDIDGPQTIPGASGLTAYYPSAPETGLIATATQLSFNFSGSDTVFFYTSGTIPATGNFVCFSGTTVTQCETLDTGSIGYGAHLFWPGFSAESGTQVIATASGSPVPEPSSLLLLGTGLLGLAFVAFRKAKSSGLTLSM